LLDPLIRKVTSPKRERRETTMHLAQRLDPSFKPTATTLKARERQAGQRLVEIYAEREAAMRLKPRSQPPASDSDEITADL
jgi:hypothetical protein